MVRISGAGVDVWSFQQILEVKMYSMKPIYTNVDSIEIPDNIYKMKSLHIEDDVSQSSAGSNVRDVRLFFFSLL